MVTVTFQGTPAEIHSDMRAMLNLSKGAGATRAIGEGPQMTRTEVMARVQERTDAQMATGMNAATLADVARTQPEPTPEKILAPVPEEKPKRTRRTKAEIEAAKSNGVTDHAPAAAPTETKTEPSRAEEAPASVAPPIVNKEAVHQALQQVNVAVGLPKAREILSKFNVNRISEIKEDQFAKFIEECNSAVMMA